MVNANGLIAVYRATESPFTYSQIHTFPTFMTNHKPFRRVNFFIKAQTLVPDLPATKMKHKVLFGALSCPAYGDAV
jgi:hypothetical protein